MKTLERVRRSIANRTGKVILRSELAVLGSTTQLSRALSQLVMEGRLMRVSKGAYVKTRVNQFTGKPSPDGTLESISTELFQKLKVPIGPGRLAREYNNGATTQVPAQPVVNTYNRRISRRVEVGGRALIYEKNNRRTKGND